MKLSLFLLLLAGNAWAAGITASVEFDENGKSVPSAGVCCSTGPVTLTITGTGWDAEKEPAVVWCQTVMDDSGWALTDKEICGMSDHSIIWRKKTKGD